VFSRRVTFLGLAPPKITKESYAEKDAAAAGVSGYRTPFQWYGEYQFL